MNLLFIVADQFRADHLSLLGHPAVRTPNLDALAVEGMCFANHWANASPCGPSRACLLTGTYQSQNRSIRNGFPIAPNIGNVAEDLCHLGRNPTLFGYTSTSPDPHTVPFGADDWRSYHQIMPGFNTGIHLRDNMENWAAWMAQHGHSYEERGEDLWLPERRNPQWSGPPTLAPTRFPDALSETNYLTDAACTYLHSAPQPWACHIAYIRPHPPFVAPEPWNTAVDPSQLPPLQRAPNADINDALHPYLGLHRRRLRNTAWCMDRTLDPAQLAGSDLDQLRATYGGMVMQVDAAVGRLIATLKDIGQYDQTLIVFTSDHGEMLGEHWLLGKDGFYDAAYRVPLIIRHPQFTKGHGRIIRVPTESVDLVPTIVESIGGRPRFECDGQSLLPVLQGESIEPWREAVVWQYDFRDPRQRSSERALHLPSEACNLAVWREARWKLVHFAGGLPPLLFDLAEDPHETRNRANDPHCHHHLLRCLDGLLGHHRRHSHRGHSRWYAHEHGPIDCWYPSQ